jgi:hypothetical protein
VQCLLAWIFVGGTINSSGWPDQCDLGNGAKRTGKPLGLQSSSSPLLCSCRSPAWRQSTFLTDYIKIVAGTPNQTRSDPFAKPWSTARLARARRGYLAARSRQLGRDPPLRSRPTPIGQLHSSCDSGFRSYLLRENQGPFESQCRCNRCQPRLIGRRATMWLRIASLWQGVFRI